MYTFILFTFVSLVNVFIPRIELTSENYTHTHIYIYIHIYEFVHISTQLAPDCIYVFTLHTRSFKYEK